MDLLEASNGSARDRTIAEFKNGKGAALLAELGITIRRYNGRNRFFYETERDAVAILKSRGLTSASKVQRVFKFTRPGVLFLNI